ncbi:MAG: 2-oxo acid dehydrogenase subunit E2 [Gammaproteobacteria bacterium]|nr:MAG: 2-oxo acid dehydrogenase subunit E2 [Gammaproteobacteria bacterium]RLA33435.1 MAG: 2-oxo acid dehydrogenase subunit E2 [Gammaproteobacteria bacterium]
MTTFNLPDLGEGLPDAEIVSWHVAEGDAVKTDDLLVSVETAKAVVEVPSPHTGVITKLYASAGDIVATGAPLVDFAEGASAEVAQPAPAVEEKTENAATVVGNVPTSSEVLQETAIAGGSRRRKKGRIKATPSVRTQAKRLGIDLAEVTPTGKNGQITAKDLEAFGGKQKSQARPAVSRPAMAPGQATALRGSRRAMAQSMSMNRDQVALCTMFDDADIHEWLNKRDFTARIMRALVAGCAAEPALNGFFDAESMIHQTESRVDMAMAVDTEGGLIVPVIRNVEEMSLDEIRAAVAKVKQATINRSVAPQDMVNYTITLSNFGMLAGRYATPLMVPPTVAILGTGKLQHDVVAVMGGIEVHRRIPLSLSFDHRCVTGGEACRFLAAVIQDLEKPQ